MDSRQQWAGICALGGRTPAAFPSVYPSRKPWSRVCLSAVHEVRRALKAVYMWLGFEFLRWSNIDDEDQSAVAWITLNSRTELNMEKTSGMELFRMIHVVVQVVSDSYGISPLSRALPRPYHRIDVNRFYRGDFLNFKAENYTRRRMERGCSPDGLKFSFVKRSAAMHLIFWK